ncbi:GGDEF domain-containing protein [Candidatus Woesearchaeota archaeon]|nr:GGDEF domain-containing protein [Candidatus Woesearchaeota archaeon]
MGEHAEQNSEIGDLESRADKVMTHPAFQKARDLANPESGFYRAIAEAEREYRALEEKSAHLEEENLHLRKELEEEKALTAKLRPLAITDGLTGAYNHRYFREELKTEMKRSDRSKTPLSLLFIDIDDYKSFNDTYGHDAGDYVLQELTRIAKAVLRETDIFARYGGEEFAAILPDTNEEDAKHAAERLRKAVENADLEYKGEKMNFTISIGVAAHRSESADDFITNADKLMYLAKDAGKNCSVTRNFAEKELGIDLSLYSNKKQ